MSLKTLGTSALQHKRNLFLYYAFPQYCCNAIAYTDSPNMQSNQPFHYEFVSDFHMGYDVGYRPNQ